MLACRPELSERGFRRVRARLSRRAVLRRVSRALHAVRIEGSFAGRAQDQVEGLLGAGGAVPVGLGHAAEATVASHDGDGGVRQAGEVARQVADVSPAPVLVVGEIAYVVHAVLHGPAVAHQLEKLLRSGAFRAERGEAPGHLEAVPAGLEDLALAPGERFGPVDVRLVRCRTDGEDFNLATTLLDADDVSVDDLGSLCHGRWSIEELYKVSKQTVAVDEFHGQTERGVRQELYAHFNLIAMTRLLSGHGDGLLADMREHGKERQTVNFRNAVAIVAANLEETLLAQVDAVARAVTRMAEGILKVRSRLRPGRTYPRKSMKPVSKWNRRSKAIA